MAEEEWDQVIAVNLKGTFLPCKAVQIVYHNGGDMMLG